MYLGNTYPMDTYAVPEGYCAHASPSSDVSMDSTYPPLLPGADGQATAFEVTPQSEEESGPQTISISTAFNPQTLPTQPNLIFSSSDCVLFYVDMNVVTKASPRAFQAVIAASPMCEVSDNSMRIVPLDEISPVLNVILHALYGTSCAQHSPSFEILADAVDHMPLYDISPFALITPSSHMNDILLSHAPVHPLDVYALAGHYHLHDLAVATSSHLLSHTLSSLSDDIAVKMGPVYLKRLFCLHLDRFTALKEMLLYPPYPHPPTPECTFADQKCLTRAWALVSAYLAWEARADLLTHSIKLAFGPLTDDLACQFCRKSLEAKIYDSVAKWATVKRTI